MTPRRLLVLLAAITLIAGGVPESAWAHPGHGPMSGSPHHGVTATPHHGTAPGGASVVPGDMGQPAFRLHDSRAAARHHAPLAVLLVAAALALLVILPDRRSTLAPVLACLLGTVAFEGAAHAVFHLSHLPHADGLAIGASPMQPAVPDPDVVVPATPVLALLTEALWSYGVSLPDVLVHVPQGRAPPYSPA